jgi:hypothetical protein
MTVGRHGDGYTWIRIMVEWYGASYRNVYGSEVAPCQSHQSAFPVHHLQSSTLKFKSAYSNVPKKIEYATTYRTKDPVNIFLIPRRCGLKDDSIAEKQIEQTRSLSSAGQNMAITLAEFDLIHVPAADQAAGARLALYLRFAQRLRKWSV